MNITPMAHQTHIAQFKRDHARCFNTSDPGTGKTIASLLGYLDAPRSDRLLVVAPLSILRPAWANDIDKMGVGLRWRVAHGSPQKRMEAFKSTAEVVIMNSDGVKWLYEQAQATPGFLKDFSHCVVDEFTAFKNRTTQRTRALNRLATLFEHLWMLSGTPNSNSVLDLFAPAFMLDQGARLGSSFWKFRSQVCEPEQVGPDAHMVKWHDREGALDTVSALLADITIRYELAECVDLPKNRVTEYLIDLPPKLLRQYRQLEQEAKLITAHGVIDAIHAGTKVKKLLQLLSGAAYGDGSGAVKVHSERYELVMDLVEERNQCVVAFNWKHERDELLKLAKSRGISTAVIDGSVAAGPRRDVMVDKFQSGEARIVLCHPRSAGHGLTLVAGTTTIWCSPTYNAEHYTQLNARINRKGQTQPTETIHIAARDTAEIDVYAKLQGKVSRMESLLSLFTGLRSAA